MEEKKPRPRRRSAPMQDQLLRQARLHDDPADTDDTASPPPRVIRLDDHVVAIDDDERLSPAGGWFG
jgi:hypothetical protein